MIIQLLMYTYLIHHVAGQRGRERVHGQQLERLFQFQPDLVDSHLCAYVKRDAIDATVAG